MLYICHIYADESHCLVVIGEGGDLSALCHGRRFAWLHGRMVVSRTYVFFLLYKKATNLGKQYLLL